MVMKKYNKLGLGILGSTIAVGVIPNISGTSAEQGVKDNFAQGMGNVSKTFPTMGKMIGTGMVLKSTGSLQKSSKKMLKSLKGGSL